MQSRATFQAYTEVNDGFGNTYGEWEDWFQRWCNIRFLRGGETVMASRLEAQPPAIMTVRKDSGTDQITPEWRVLVNGRAYAIHAPPSF
jgi:SPP1 family predicted phage head-tail adaptor